MPLPTLTPQPKAETRRPQAIFGGFEDFFEQSVELITKGQGEFVTENSGNFTPESTQTFSNGEINDFQTPRINPEMRRQQITQELAQTQRLTAIEPIVEEKKVEINELNGFDPTYEGTVDQEGNATIYHQTNADQKRIENLALRLQNERETKISAQKGPSKSPKGAAGPNVNMNTTFEDQNMNRVG